MLKSHLILCSIATAVMLTSCTSGNAALTRNGERPKVLRYAFTLQNEDPAAGEQQRVNITRAILSSPRFLLVDEPTASLDLKTKDAVIDMLLELKSSGTSILLITHDEHTLNRLSDRSLHLENGRVRETVEV